MAFENYQTKESVTLVFTGEGKGKTSASIGLLARALGHGWRVSYVQFVKTWKTGESVFIKTLLRSKLFDGQLDYYSGGRGFFNAGELSAKDVSHDEHREAAHDAYQRAFEHVASGDYQLVICDEINNAVHDGLLPDDSLEKLLDARSPKTSLCLTGRDFPTDLLSKVDIATDMSKLKHHFDDEYLANEGIDY